MFVGFEVARDLVKSFTVVMWGIVSNAIAGALEHVCYKV